MLINNVSETWGFFLQTAGGLRRKFVRIFLYLYPIVHGIWEFTVLLHMVAYVFGRSRHHSPLLRLAGVVLLNLTEDDLSAIARRGAARPLLEELAGKR